MPFKIERFFKVRPFLYHVTDRANVPRLRQRPIIEPAAELLRQAGRSAILNQRRTGSVPVNVNGEHVVLKDQAPLVFANVELPSGWDEGDLVAHLNEHTFFWPGTESGPIRAGKRLHAHYAADAPAVLRFPTAALFRANPDVPPLFCAFNSGAPRMQAGRRVSRGPDLFLRAAAFPRNAGDVVEVVFRGSVRLPLSTEMQAEDGEWVPLTLGRRPPMTRLPDYKQQSWVYHHHRFGLAGEGQADAIERRLRSDQGRVLSVGCGPEGHRINALADCGDQLVGLDHNEQVIAKAKTETRASIPLLRAEADALPFRNETFQHVLALGVFAYVPDPLPVLREFHRVCRPGGTAYLTNAVRHPKDPLREAAAAVGFTVIEDMEGHCPAATGEIKRRYMLVLRRLDGEPSL